MLLGMVRVAKLGEWVFFAILFGVWLAVFFQARIGLPRALAGIILALSTPFLFIAFYLVNLISRRVRN